MALAAQCSSVHGVKPCSLLQSIPRDRHAYLLFKTQAMTNPSLCRRSFWLFGLVPMAVLSTITRHSCQSVCFAPGLCSSDFQTVWPRLGCCYLVFSSSCACRSLSMQKSCLLRAPTPPQLQCQDLRQWPTFICSQRLLHPQKLCTSPTPSAQLPTLLCNLSVRLHAQQAD